MSWVPLAAASGSHSPHAARHGRPAPLADLTGAAGRSPPGCHGHGHGHGHDHGHDRPAATALKRRRRRLSDADVADPSLHVTPGPMATPSRPRQAAMPTAATAPAATAADRRELRWHRPHPPSPRARRDANANANANANDDDNDDEAAASATPVRRRLFEGLRDPAVRDTETDLATAPLTATAQRTPARATGHGDPADAVATPSVGIRGRALRVPVTAPATTQPPRAQAWVESKRPLPMTPMRIVTQPSRSPPPPLGGPPVVSPSDRRYQMPTTPPSQRRRLDAPAGPDTPWSPIAMASPKRMAAAPASPWPAHAGDIDALTTPLDADSAVTLHFIVIQQTLVPVHITARYVRRDGHRALLVSEPGVMRLVYHLATSRHPPPPELLAAVPFAPVVWAREPWAAPPSVRLRCRHRFLAAAAACLRLELGPPQPSAAVRRRRSPVSALWRPVIEADCPSASASALAPSAPAAAAPASASAPPSPVGPASPASLPATAPTPARRHACVRSPAEIRSPGHLGDAIVPTTFSPPASARRLPRSPIPARYRRWSANPPRSPSPVDALAGPAVADSAPLVDATAPTVAVTTAAVAVVAATTSTAAATETMTTMATPAATATTTATPASATTMAAPVSAAPVSASVMTINATATAEVVTLTAGTETTAVAMTTTATATADIATTTTATATAEVAMATTATATEPDAGWMVDHGTDAFPDPSSPAPVAMAMPLPLARRSAETQDVEAPLSLGLTMAAMDALDVDAVDAVAVDTAAVDTTAVDTAAADITAGSTADTTDVDAVAVDGVAVDAVAVSPALASTAGIFEPRAISEATSPAPVANDGFVRPEMRAVPAVHATAAVPMFATATAPATLSPVTEGTAAARLAAVPSPVLVSAAMDTPVAASATTLSATTTITGTSAREPILAVPAAPAVLPTSAQPASRSVDSAVPDSAALGSPLPLASPTLSPTLSPTPASTTASTAAVAMAMARPLLVPAWSAAADDGRAPLAHPVSPAMRRYATAAGMDAWTAMDVDEALAAPGSSLPALSDAGARSIAAPSEADLLSVASTAPATGSSPRRPRIPSLASNEPADGASDANMGSPAAAAAATVTRLSVMHDGEGDGDDRPRATSLSPSVRTMKRWIRAADRASPGPRAASATTTTASPLSASNRTSAKAGDPVLDGAPQTARALAPHVVQWMAQHVKPPSASTAAAAAAASRTTRASPNKRRDLSSPTVFPSSEAWASASTDGRGVRSLKRVSPVKSVRGISTTAASPRSGDLSARPPFVSTVASTASTSVVKRPSSPSRRVLVSPRAAPRTVLQYTTAKPMGSRNALLRRAHRPHRSTAAATLAAVSASLHATGPRPLSSPAATRPLVRHRPAPLFVATSNDSFDDDALRRALGFTPVKVARPDGVASSPATATADAGTEMMVEPVVDAETEMMAEPAMDASTEMAVESYVDAETEIAAKPYVDVETEMTVEPAVDAGTEMAIEPAVDAATETAAEPYVNAETETDPMPEPLASSGSLSPPDPSAPAPPPALMSVLPVAGTFGPLSADEDASSFSSSVPQASETAADGAVTRGSDERPDGTPPDLVLLTPPSLPMELPASAVAVAETAAGTSITSVGNSASTSMRPPLRLSSLPLAAPFGPEPLPTASMHERQRRPLEKPSAPAFLSASIAASTSAPPSESESESDIVPDPRSPPPPPVAAASPRSPKLAYRAEAWSSDSDADRSASPSRRRTLSGPRRIVVHRDIAAALPIQAWTSPSPPAAKRRRRNDNARDARAFFSDDDDAAAAPSRTSAAASSTPSRDGARDGGNAALPPWLSPEDQRRITRVLRQLERAGATPATIRIRHRTVVPGPPPAAADSGSGSAGTTRRPQSAPASAVRGAPATRGRGRTPASRARRPAWTPSATPRSAVWSVVKSLFSP